MENGFEKLNLNTDDCKKREGYLAWEDYFMAVAYLSSQRSKDPSTQVGACIVNDEKKIVGVGYNGMPNNCNDDELPWGKQSDDPLSNKYLYVCHAEMNAVLNKISADLKGCIIYTAVFPCNECAKIIIQAGIKEVVYHSDKHRDKPATHASKRMLTMAGIPYRQYTPKSKTITINFEDFDLETSSL